MSAPSGRVMRTHGESSSLMPSGVATRDHTASQDADSREETRKPITGGPRRDAISAAGPPGGWLAHLAVALGDRLGRAVAVAREAPVGAVVVEPVVGETLLVQVRLLLVDLGLGARLARLALGELGALLACLRLGAVAPGDLLTATL